MKRFLFLLLLVCQLVNLSAQNTTYFYGRDKVQSKNETAALYSVQIFDDCTYVTIELVPTKNRSRMTFFTSPYTYIQAESVKLPLLGALSSDGTSYHSCTIYDNWGWENVKKGEAYHYTLVFSGRIPAGITSFSLIDDYSEYHGYCFKNYTINNPNANATAYDEISVRQNIDMNNDGIVGIYEGINEQGYKLGCIKHDNTYYFIYLGSKTNKSWWKVGDVKAILRPSATAGLFKADWYMEDKSTNSDVYVIFERGQMKTIMPNEETGYLKMYPSSSPSNANTPSREAQKWSGSGFALFNGYITTNYHVIEGAKSIYIKGIKGNFSIPYEATVVASDKHNDLALLKINDHRFTGFGNIPYRVKIATADVGEEIFVLGYPLTTTMGDEVKLTTGVISSKTGFKGDVSLYQISAPIQPGNSGGPLFDGQGNLIGIVNAKHTQAENVGYAIKTSYLQNLIESVTSSSILPNNNQVSEMALTGKVKTIKNFVYMIECSNQPSSSNNRASYNAYNTNNNDITVNNPIYAAVRNNGALKITQVQVSDNYTKIKFEYTNLYASDGWCSIDPSAYIISNDTGKKYSMIRAEGIPTSPQAHYFSRQYEKLYFTLIFPALPKNTAQFSFIETEDSEWRFYNIKLQ
ncbi:S1C family serine protease [Parabacteroides bouchesdurhonensis]|uniref:S1C family serine protease n=1 Tax=Parabacteroides bouchesdurhonensis TaxID=1936995 RepID=UPI000C8446D6|nr:S1C family serine protease [Parabacteroides bouchesdurhonensis]